MTIESDALENLSGAGAPSEHAIAEHLKDENEKASRFAGLLDKMGRAFDPALHKVGSDGDPVLTKGGQLSMRPGRRLGGHNTTTSTPPTDPQKENAPPDPFKTGAETVMLIETLGMMLGGAHFQIKEQSERDAMVSAWGRCYEKWGVTEIPPEVALLAAMGGYALLHEGRRNTIFAALKPKKKAPETPTLEIVRSDADAPHSDRGPDGIGEIPFGKGARDPLPTPGAD